jgi:hypothetical protein
VARPAARVAKIGAEGELAVGPRRDQLVGATVPEGDDLVEVGGRLASLVLERNRRHGHPDVIGEEGDEAVDVAGPVGPGEPGNEVLFGR